MAKVCVEGRSGSRAGSPRCWGLPSCSPLWRRHRHDCSPCDAGPWRRLYDDPERAWAGFDPSDGLRAGARPAGGVGRGQRPVGPVAATRWRTRPSGGHGSGASRGAQAGGRPVRACARPSPDGCVYPARHAQRPARQAGCAHGGGSLAIASTAGGAALWRMGPGHDETGGDPRPREQRPRQYPREQRLRKQYRREQRRHHHPGRTLAGGPALSLDPTPGRPAKTRGDES